MTVGDCDQQPAEFPESTYLQTLECLQSSATQLLPRSQYSTTANIFVGALTDKWNVNGVIASRFGRNNRLL